MRTKSAIRNPQSALSSVALAKEEIRPSPGLRRAGNPQFAIRNCRALTVLEMLVSITLLVFIVVGLTAMFVETQRVFKTGVKQSSMTDAGQTIIDFVAADLSQLSDAQTPGITNLFWSWLTANQTYQYQDSPANVYRTNQIQEIFALVHTNAQWLGVGYAVSNSAPGVGTLYRYLISTNAPLLANTLFSNFYYAVSAMTFGTNFDRVADGVIHLKIRAFDQFGNENGYEQGQDYATAKPLYEFTYPAPAYTNNLSLVVPPAGLPNTIQLEVGVLEPEAYEQLRALPPNSPAQKTFLGNAGGKIQIYRRNIPVAGATR